MGQAAEGFPAKFKRQRIKLHTNKLNVAVGLLNQYTDFTGYLRDYLPDIRIGKTYESSTQITHPVFATAHIPDGATVFFVPRAAGSVPGLGAILVQALISAAISIAVMVLSSLLFPPPQTSNDKRKSTLYEGGLNTQKEGVALSYIAGREVLCGFNVIEADVDITNTGGTNTTATGFDAIRNRLSQAILQSNESYANLKNTVAGSKGGGKTIPNSVFSNVSLRMLGAVGMGEIEGIVGDTQEEKEKNIYINETPARNRGTNQLDFQGFAWEERPGIAGQSALPMTPGITSIQNENVELKYSTGPLTYTITAGSVNRAKMIINYDALLYTDKKGNQSPTSVTVAFNVKRESDPIWQPAGTYTVTEKSSERVQRTFVVDAPSGDPTEAWQFQVYRITADSTEDMLQNGTHFGGWVEITDKEYTYDGTGDAPATALFGCAIDLAQFNNGSEPPEIGLLVSGTKVRVPINFDPVTRTYTGPWNGAWKWASTDNPVWHFYHIATHPDLCAFPESYFNVSSLYLTAQFCDEKVNGRPRYSLNKQFTDEKDAWPFLVELASSIRAWPYFNGTEIILVQDRPQNQPDHYINNTMVEDGIFSYKLTPIEERYNEIRVEYDNPDDYFRKGIVVYRDEAAIAENVAKGLSSNGVISQTYYKVGCSNKQEAYDFARLLCYISQNEIESVEFHTLLTAAAYAPGQIVEIDDWTITGKQPHGRVLDIIDETHLLLDQPFSFEAGESYSAHLVVNNQLVIRPITMFLTDTTTDHVPVDTTGCEYGTPIGIVQTGGTQPRQFRIVDIIDAGNGKFTVNARLHYEGKYEWVETDAPVPDTPWTQMVLNLPPVTGLTAVGHSASDDLRGPQHSIEISWNAFTDPSLKVKSYLLEIMEPGSSQWTRAYEGTSTVFTLKDAAEGRYVISVKAINILNQSSDVASYNFDFTYGSVDGVLPPVFIGLD